ncbi:MAG: MFS transporter [Marinomonas sp.]|nr:MFS transporter [Marinomonas sp.]
MNYKSTSTKFLIFSACCLLILSFGYRSGFGLFMEPISDAMGWGRDTISFALALQNLIWGVVAVFAGGLADRYGNAKVIIAGAILYGGGMMLITVSDSPLLLNATMGLLIGSGIAGTAFGIVLPAMARAVGEERRQWALGVGTAAGSMGQFLVVPIAQQLLGSLGWEMAMLVLGASALSMAIFAMPLAPYSGANTTSSNTGPSQGLLEALWEALNNRSFLLLTAGFYVCGFQLAFVTVHMPAYLRDLGFDPWLGAWSIAVIGLCNVIGSYVAGIVSGKYSKSLVLGIIYLVRALSIVVFMLLPTSTFSVLGFSVLLGLFWLATVPPTSGLIAVLFGTRYMALLYGVVFLSHQIGSFCGVLLGGVLYEMNGSYDVVWWLSAVLALIASILHWPIKEQPVQRLATA